MFLTQWFQAMITCISSIKKRPLPDSPNHPSVDSGSKTKVEVEKRDAVSEYTLELKDIGDIMLPRDIMSRFSYPIRVPPSPGGDQTDAYGTEQVCDRCGEVVVITHDVDRDSCLFHWGKVSSTNNDGK